MEETAKTRSRGRNGKETIKNLRLREMRTSPGKKDEGTMTNGVQKREDNQETASAGFG